MNPSLSVPTDNIYKFACIFGLAIIIVSVFSFTTIYVSSLERKVQYRQAIIGIEANQQKSKSDEDLLALNKALIQVTGENESFANKVLSIVFGIGFSISALGAYRWRGKIQKRDDKLVDLQLAKLEYEIKKLAREIEQIEQSKIVAIEEDC